MAKLRLLDGRALDVIEVPRFVVTEAAIEAQAFADELDEGLEACWQRIFAGNRRAALHEIERLRYLHQSFRAEFARLAGLFEEAEPVSDCPDGIAEPSHGVAA
jgi:hypothetical protein